MFKRTTKRRDSVSSEENDITESYATLQFKVEYPTKLNQTLYMVGNKEELGNWDENAAIKLINTDNTSSIWESQISIECPVGMTIKYKYLIIDSKNNKKIYEKLPNDSTNPTGAISTLVYGIEWDLTMDFLSDVINENNGQKFIENSVGMGNYEDTNGYKFIALPNVNWYGFRVALYIK